MAGEPPGPERSGERAWLNRSGSPSSAASGRSAATARSSSRTGRLVVLDCGVMFPNPEMPGVDLVLPDFTFLRERAGDVDGIVLTHGHEDHVGALAYLMRDVDAPIYGSA